jgi:hypothetical protein
MADPYIEDITGVKDARIRGGALLPRRSVIEIDGALVVDDPVGGQTRITIRQPFKQQEMIASQWPDLVVADFIIPHAELDADSYRLDGIVKLIGLDAPRLGGRHKLWLINADGDSIEISHQDIAAPATKRIVTLTGSDVTFAANQKVLLVYQLADSRWHAIG